jgi:outer membrane protein assembly factor BamE
MRRLIFIAVLAGGCSMPSLSPYRIDVQQGNYVTQEMVSKLKPGMTRAQVRYALGAPLIVDPFHTDRWDYVYMYNKAGRLAEQRRIVVIFEGDKLLRVDGDIVPAIATPGDKTQAKPSAIAPPASAGGREAGGPPESPGSALPESSSANAGGEQPKEEKGFFGRMLDTLGF